MSGTSRAALRAAAARVAFSATLRLDAELLLAHALGITRERLLLTLDDHVVPPGFAALVERRAAHEPIAYITGTRAFWTIDLHVAPGVLIPRADSETLIEAAVAHFHGGEGPAQVLDLGTGPGTLLLAALDQWPRARGLGVDRSATAVALARRNAAALGMTERAVFAEGDWVDGVEGRFDLILANPPYIAVAEHLPAEVAEFEPREALFAGVDGLDDYRRIAPALPRLLAQAGVACVEIGATQADRAGALFRAAGLTTAVRQDLAGRDRCLVVTP